MSTNKIRPPVKWHGGKHYLAERIIKLFPTHNTYVEPFGGAASVLLNKKPSDVEVYNDINRSLYRLFWVLRNRSDDLIKALTLTPYSEEEFDNSHLNDQVDVIEAARRDFVRWRQSIGGRGKGFSRSLHRSRRGMADVVSGWLSAIDTQLPLIVERLRRVQIVCFDFVEVIEYWDSPNTLFYCDPPYLPSTRKTPDVYDHEMSEERHMQFLRCIKRAKGKFVVSAYPSEMYERALSHWVKHEIAVPNHAAGGTKKEWKTEVLWLNY